MSDLYCSQCGEPWDQDYVRHELHPSDRVRFLQGAGCESCDFGASCRQCSGTGREKFTDAVHIVSKSCKACFGTRFLIIRQLVATDQPARWIYGYHPNIRALDNPDIIVRYRDEIALDGPIRVAKAYCPACRESAPPCPVCNGSGELQSAPGGDLEAARSELEASDEEPLAILTRRALT